MSRFLRSVPINRVTLCPTCAGSDSNLLYSLNLRSLKHSPTLLDLKLVLGWIPPESVSAVLTQLGSSVVLANAELWSRVPAEKL